jgi:hypothetical protein
MCPFLAHYFHPLEDRGKKETGDTFYGKLNMKKVGNINQSVTEY